MVLLSIDWTNLHELLRSLYDEMMPLCEDMASVAKGVAGIGALFYVWPTGCGSPFQGRKRLTCFRFSGRLCWAFASCSSPLWYWGQSTGFFPPYAVPLPHWLNSRLST